MLSLFSLLPLLTLSLWLLIKKVVVFILVRVVALLVAYVVNVVVVVVAETRPLKNLVLVEVCLDNCFGGWRKWWKSWEWWCTHSSSPGLLASGTATRALQNILDLNKMVASKALRYNFSFGNSLSKQLQNLTKVNKSCLAKIITSFTSFCEFF